MYDFWYFYNRLTMCTYSTPFYICTYVQIQNIQYYYDFQTPFLSIKKCFAVCVKLQRPITSASFLLAVFWALTSGSDGKKASLLFVRRTSQLHLRFLVKILFHMKNYLLLREECNFSEHQFE